MTEDLMMRNSLMEYATRCLAMQVEVSYDDCLFTVIDGKLCILKILKLAKQGVLQISKVFDSIWNGGTNLKDCLYLDLSDLEEIGDNSLQNNKFCVVNCKNVITIGAAAFYKCVDLFSIDCRSVMFIKENAFYKCLNLDTITLGNAEFIDESAFYGTNLRKVEFNGCKKEWLELLDKTSSYELHHVKKIIYLKH